MRDLTAIITFTILGICVVGLSIALAVQTIRVQNQYKITMDAKSQLYACELEAFELKQDPY